VDGSSGEIDYFEYVFFRQAPAPCDFK